jgi:hypothetical protein
MGYSVSYREGNIVIRAAAQPSAFAALASLATDARFVKEDNRLLSRAPVCATSLESALRLFGWHSQSDGAGDLVHVWMAGSELAYSEDMFLALAPSIDSGGYVEFIGEDGDIWRWSFTGRDMIETYPDLHWPVEPRNTSRVRIARRLCACLAAMRALPRTRR